MGPNQPYQFPFARYPAVRILLIMILGIVSAYRLQLALHVWVISLIVVVALFIYFNYRSDRSLHLKFYFRAQTMYLISIFLFGAAWYSLTISKAESLSRALLETYTWEEVEFKGELRQIRRSATGTYQLDLQIAETILLDSLPLSESYTIRALLSSEKAVPAGHMKLGDQIRFRATIYPLEGKKNPREFDYKQYLSTLGIHHQAGIDTILSITPTTRKLRWSRLRQWMLDRINHNFDTQTAPLAKALLIGYKQELTQDDKVAFSRVGLSHIMAVSGLHVGFLLAPFWFLIPYFWTWKYGRQVGLLLLILLLITYAGLTGFSASVTRASITGGFIMYAKLFNKVRDTINLTAVAAILILLINPGELLEIGFQLSFGAVYIILLTMPVASLAIPNRIRYTWFGKLIMIVVVSFFVQAGLYPILSFYFGEFSLIGPLANAVVVPFLGVIMPYALLMVLVGSIFPEAAFYLNIPVQYFLKGLQAFVSETSAWEGSWIQTTSPEPILFAIWITGLFLFASLQIPRMRWRFLIILLGLITIQQAAMLMQKLRPASLVITVFDVGQGDAVLIKTPGNKHLLIDAGRWTPGYNSGKYVLMPHLKAEGITKLDAVFLSHPHADHIGGILELINSVPIDTIYNSGYSYSSNLYKNYLIQAAEKEIPVSSLVEGTSLRLDPSMRIFIYGPSKSPTGSDPNEHSLILELHYGSTELLFMGDAGAEQEARLLKNYGNLLNTNFLKVGHHGSKTSSSIPFLKVTTPDHAVVSLAKSNKFRHPHREALARLYTTKSDIHFTSLEGALMFTSDGKAIRKVDWK